LTRDNLATIRKLVSAAFNDDELKAFCFDHFPDVYQDFTAGQTQGQRVQLLLDFAARQGQIPRLLAAIAQANPHQYERFEGELQSPDIGPDFAVKSFEPETIFIPAGPFRMGNADAAAPAAERPQHTLALPDYRIGKYPVTVAEYAAFVKETRAVEWANSSTAKKAGWFNLEPPKDKLDHPVTGVSWFDALAYCAWLSGKTGRRYTLPSEAEWEKAALTRQGDKVTGWQGDRVQARYPWGDEWEDGRCNAASDGTTAVTAHGAGASGSGVEDLLGNVQEWTCSLWGRQPGRPDTGYPYDPADGREATDPAKLPAQARLVHRGGSFKSAPADLRITARGNATPDSRIAWRGFRVAMLVLI
jgi:formylglycine-generating enzyme required for sulfatase activity